MADRTGGSDRAAIDTWLLQVLNIAPGDLKHTAEARNRAIQQAYDEAASRAGLRIVTGSLGNLTADDATYPLPIAWLDVQALWRVVDGVQYALRPATEGQLDAEFPGWQQAASGTPAYWVTRGAQVVLYPTPDTTSGTLEGRGYQLYGAFAGDADALDTPRILDYPLACRAALILAPEHPQAAAWTVEWERGAEQFARWCRQTQERGRRRQRALWRPGLGRRQ